MMMMIYFLCLLFFLGISFIKKKEFFAYLIFSKKGYQKLKKTIFTYGYTYNITTHLFANLCFIGLLALLCYEFHIRLESFILFACILSLMFPHLVIWLLYHAYQEKLFNSFTLFLQTFLAVFKLDPKVYPALCECEKVCEGEVQTLIQDMQHVLMEEGSLEKAFALLLHYQPHFIVHNLVTLANVIEQHGGRYNEGLDLIQDDIDDWIEDVYSYKKKQASTKNKMMCLCVMSIGIAFLAKRMLSQIDFDTTSDIYQAAAFIFLASLMFTVFMAHRIFSVSWFDKEEQL